jgi:low affinity Fe/Cu permease
MKSKAVERSSFDNITDTATNWIGSVTGFISALVVILVWGLAGPWCSFSETWQLVINTGTTIITFLMLFLLQRSQNIQGLALQRKLDELIKAIDKADNRVIGIETKPEELE